MKQAIYAGTFDPFTYGHLDIVHRSLGLFDRLTILIAVSPSKTPLFSVGERQSMIQEIFNKDPRVEVSCWEGLVVDFAKQKNIKHFVRGLRPTGDFEVEFQMAAMNRHLYQDIDTVFLMTGPENYYVSSTLVREVYNHRGDIAKFVPKEVLQRLKK